MALVLLPQAKLHLKVTDTNSDEDIQLKLDQASDIILDYLKGGAGVSWTWKTVPGPVQAATLLMLTHLHTHRGDDMTVDAHVWEAVERLLMRFRDPALA